MAQNYVVNYDINVTSNDATKNLNAFVRATNKLPTAHTNLTQFMTTWQQFAAQANALKPVRFSIDVRKAQETLNRVIKKLEKIHALCANAPVLNITSATSQSAQKGAKATRRTSSMPPIIPNNVGYRVLGPSMIDSGGVGVVDMLKGMGIAYGISGIGQLISKTVQQSVEYENIMQTTKNILSTHDRTASFENRFNQMERIVRETGVNTKYTSPEVAGAAKFLAMAGLNVDDIQHAIAPIADIALVGDTDLATTADLMTNIITAYDIAPSQLRKAEDIMTMTFTKTNTTITDIAEAFKYSASLLSAAGVSFQESSAAIGILGDAGIKGSQAGTTMRTIMHNIMNPTKSQKAAWEALGISRHDEFGELRTPNEIFNDLAKKNVGPEYFTKLFRVTAAQGAAALTAHIEKWNTVVSDNFLSEGLVAKLAEAKKNTVQGLWYKLTSTITEGGLQAFEEMQTPIKDLLRELIAQIGSPESVKFIKNLGHTLLELVNFIKRFTTILISLYRTFEGTIMLWLKFQMAAKGVVSVLRIFRSMLNIGGYAVVFAHNAVMMGQSMVGLAAKIKHTTAVWIRFLKIQAASGKLKHGLFAGLKGLYSGFQSSGGLVGIGSLGLGIAGGAIGKNAFESGTTGEVFGMLGGGMLGLLIPQLLAAGGPIAIILGVVAALTLLTTGIINYSKRVKEATKASEGLVTSLHSLGTDMMEVSTPQQLIMANMRLFTGELEDQNRQLELSSELMKRYMDAKNGLADKDNTPATKWQETSWGGKYKQLVDKRVIWDASPYKPLIEELGGHTGTNGLGVFEFSLPGLHDTLGTYSLEQNAHIIAARTMGRDKNNPFYTAIEQYLQSAIFDVQSQKELAGVIEHARAMIPGVAISEPLTRKEFKEQIQTVEQLGSYSQFNDELVQSVNPMIDLYDKIAQAMLKISDSNQPMSVESILSHMIPATSGGVFDTADDVDWIGWLNANKDDVDLRSTMSEVYSTIQTIYENLNSKNPFKNELKKMIDDDVWKTYLGDMYVNRTLDLYNPNGGGNGDEDPDPSNFASQYSTSATPKQVIIKIENLLNVDKLDMADPNVTAAVEEFMDKAGEMMVSQIVSCANEAGELIYNNLG